MSQYPLLKEKLIAEKSSLGEYMTAWQYKNSGFDIKTYYAAAVYSNGNEKDWTEAVLDRYDLSYEQAEKRSEQLGYCISRLENAMSYPDYAKYVFRSSEELLSVSLLDTDSFAAKNAVKTKHDFYGLDAIRPTAESDIGVLSLFSDGYADIIAVICAFVSAVTAALYINPKLFRQPSAYIDRLCRSGSRSFDIHKQCRAYERLSGAWKYAPPYPVGRGFPNKQHDDEYSDTYFT